MLTAGAEQMRYARVARQATAGLLGVFMLVMVGHWWIGRALVAPIVQKQTEELKETEREMWEEVNRESTNAIPAQLVLQPSHFERPEPKTLAEKQRFAETAEQERKRRFAPDGVVYNLKPLKIGPRNQSTVVAAESELMLIKKNDDRTVHVKWNGVEADVLADDVTNDRDWLAAYQNLHRNDRH